MAVEIHPLTPALREPYLRFFDGPAFADNPAWASCYCMHMLHAGTAEAWDRATAAENRERVAACIDRGANDGLLALDGGEVVGWLQAARAETYIA